jgi:hypothetical protein
VHARLPTLRVDIGYVALASPRMMSGDSAQATFPTRAERSEKAHEGIVAPTCAWKHPVFYWTVIANTGERFSDFAPCVASVNERTPSHSRRRCMVGPQGSLPGMAGRSRRSRAPLSWLVSRATPT